MDLQKTKGQGHELLCDTGIPVRNGNLGNDRTTKTKAASVRKQLGTKNSKSNEGRQENNGGVISGETGVQRSLTERLVRSRLQWAGHVERMADARLPKRAAELREESRRRRGRPTLRWEDCVKRDVKKAGEDEDWKKTRCRGGWKRLSDEEVKKLRQQEEREIPKCLNSACDATILPVYTTAAKGWCKEREHDFRGTENTFLQLRRFPRIYGIPL